MRVQGLPIESPVTIPVGYEDHSLTIRGPCRWPFLPFCQRKVFRWTDTRSVGREVGDIHAELRGPLQKCDLRSVRGGGGGIHAVLATMGQLCRLF
jgi:hypothetical protein